MSISVVTITKNGAHSIADVVRNGLEIGEEHIVVDTGSTDDTIKIAEKAGAHVVEYKGEFDYSTPRNVGMQHATGDYVLSLDDDERVDPFYIPVLQSAAASGEHEHYSVGWFTQGDWTSYPKLIKNNKLSEFRGMRLEFPYPTRPTHGINVKVHNTRHRVHNDRERTDRLRRGLNRREAQRLRQDHKGSIEVIVEYMHRLHHCSGSVNGFIDGTEYVRRIQELYDEGKSIQSDHEPLHTVAAQIHFRSGMMNSAWNALSCIPETTASATALVYMAEVQAHGIIEQDSLGPSINEQKGIEAERLITAAIDKNQYFLYYLIRAEIFGLQGKIESCRQDMDTADALMPGLPEVAKFRNAFGN